ncbi:DNA primase [Perilla frutescens var. frutescens]|nr:DNA primase [Perilla frutescens var. frutescens]
MSHREASKVVNKDIDSHFVLRLVYRREEELRKWFISMETMLDSDPDPTRQELEGQEDDNDANFLDQSTSPSTLLHLQDPNMQQQLAAKCIQTVLQNGAKTRLPITEESAARCIQSVYIGFLNNAEILWEDLQIGERIGIEIH